ncbi:hypothetical protein Nepgr_009432 [Nepenthes gracilis]|uniref:Uncharacterized protein n=1 Tax=Nepenthes gracilis TaxID=150966 RepID=A0AAD3SBD4_NEPGR|nr:hypothetical protein Nepgr_009432 [Nepenthes gracilis]
MARIQSDGPPAVLRLINPSDVVVLFPPPPPTSLLPPCRNQPSCFFVHKERKTDRFSPFKQERGFEEGLFGEPSDENIRAESVYLSSASLCLARVS